jgi:hypothetical protein
VDGVYENLWRYACRKPLCGLVVSVEDYKHRDPGFDFRALLRIFSEGVRSGTGSTQPRYRIS